MRTLRTFGAGRILVLSFVACAAALAGCAEPDKLVSSGENFLTFERSFTDASAQSVRNEAEKRCAYKNKAMVAVLTSDTCNLTRCFTNYQCVTRADALKNAL
jgi:hypothetical protein